MRSSFIAPWIKLPCYGVLLSAGLLASPVAMGQELPGTEPEIAAPEPAPEAAAETPPAAQEVQADIPAGINMSDIPANSCLAKAGNLDGSGADLPQSIDGTALKKESQLKKIRKKAKDGSLLVINGGDFKNWDMSEIKDLSNVCFQNADLSGSNWSGQRYDGMGFINSNLTGANLSNAVMQHVLIRSTIMENSNAKNADFSFGQFDGGWDASIANWDLSQAKLQSFRFSCGNAESNGCAFDRQGVIINGADFSNSTLINFALWDSDWSATRLDNAIITLNQLPYFAGAKIEDRILIAGAGQISSISASSLTTLAEMQARNCEDIADSAARFACDTKDDGLFALARDVTMLTPTGDSRRAALRALSEHQQAIETCSADEDMAAKSACLKQALTARRMALLPAAVAPAWSGSAPYAVFVETALDTGKPDGAAALEQVAPVLTSTSSHIILMRRTNDAGAFELRGAYRDAEGQNICQLRSERAAFRAANLYKDVTDKRRSGALIAFSFNDRMMMDISGYTAIGTGESCPAAPGQSLAYIPMGAADFDRLWNSLN
ncbi:pentapeptide repeat-containing protein [Sphingorhabdus arenilitoris]|uniref:Pentapeptide repeat-containing protein n=1 Tax=Sphingorhabdus arenilitoris TaxID=1490041 RepID=A0ABV8RI26_9SPHN